MLGKCGGNDSNPAFGTILEYKQINYIRELGCMSNSPFFVWCRFGAKTYDRDQVRALCGVMVEGFAFFWTLPEPAGLRWNLDKGRCR
jgi:hypothetical protein